MLDGAGLDFGPLQELCRTGSVISEGGMRHGWGHAKCSAALVLIILACTVILVGAYSAELIGSVPLR